MATIGIVEDSASAVDNYLGRVDKQYQRSLQTSMYALEDEIIKLASAVLEKGDAGPKWKLAQTVKMYQQMGRILKENYVDFNSKNLWKVNDLLTATKNTYQNTEIPIEFSKLDTELLKTMRDQQLAGLESFSKRVQESIYQNMQNAIVVGSPFDELVNNIRQSISGSWGKKALSLSSKASIYAQDGIMSAYRALNVKKAREAGITHFIWYGQVIDTTRNLCAHMSGRVFSADELDDIDKEEWVGKAGSLWLYCGGYNCRHHLVPISETIARNLYDQRDGRVVVKELQPAAELPAVSESLAAKLLKTAVYGFGKGVIEGITEPIMNMFLNKVGEKIRDTLKDQGLRLYKFFKSSDDVNNFGSSTVADEFDLSDLGNLTSMNVITKGIYDLLYRSKLSKVSVVDDVALASRPISKAVNNINAITNISQEELEKLNDIAELKLAKSLDEVSNTRSVTKAIDDSVKGLDYEDAIPPSDVGKIMRGWSNTYGDITIDPSDLVITNGFKKGFVAAEHLNKEYSIIVDPFGNVLSGNKKAYAHIVAEKQVTVTVPALEKIINNPERLTRFIHTSCSSPCEIKVVDKIKDIEAISKSIEKQQKWWDNRYVLLERLRNELNSYSYSGADINWDIVKNINALSKQAKSKLGIAKLGTVGFDVGDFGNKAYYVTSNTSEYINELFNKFPKLREIFKKKGLTKLLVENDLEVSNYNSSGRVVRMGWSAQNKYRFDWSHFTEYEEDFKKYGHYMDYWSVVRHELAHHVTYSVSIDEIYDFIEENIEEIKRYIGDLRGHGSERIRGETSEYFSQLLSFVTNPIYKERLFSKQFYTELEEALTTNVDFKNKWGKFADLLNYIKTGKSKYSEEFSDLFKMFKDDYMMAIDIWDKAVTEFKYAVQHEYKYLDLKLSVYEGLLRQFLANGQFNYVTDLVKGSKFELPEYIEKAMYKVIGEPVQKAKYSYVNNDRLRVLLAEAIYDNEFTKSQLKDWNTIYNELGAEKLQEIFGVRIKDPRTAFIKTFTDHYGPGLNVKFIDSIDDAALDKLSDLLGTEYEKTTLNIIGIGDKYIKPGLDALQEYVDLLDKYVDASFLQVSANVYDMALEAMAIYHLNQVELPTQMIKVLADISKTSKLSAKAMSSTTDALAEAWLAKLKGIKLDPDLDKVVTYVQDAAQVSSEARKSMEVFISRLSGSLGDMEESKLAKVLLKLNDAELNVLASKITQINNSNFNLYEMLLLLGDEKTKTDALLKWKSLSKIKDAELLNRMDTVNGLFVRPDSEFIKSYLEKHWFGFDSRDLYDDIFNSAVVNEFNLAGTFTPNIGIIPKERISRVISDTFRDIYNGTQLAIDESKGNTAYRVYRGIPKSGRATSPNGLMLYTFSKEEALGPDFIPAGQTGRVEEYLISSKQIFAADKFHLGDVRRANDIDIEDVEIGDYLSGRLFKNYEGKNLLYAFDEIPLGNDYSTWRKVDAAIIAMERGKLANQRAIDLASITGSFTGEEEINYQIPMIEYYRFWKSSMKQNADLFKDKGLTSKYNEMLDSLKVVMKKGGKVMDFAERQNLLKIHLEMDFGRTYPDLRDLYEVLNWSTEQIDNYVKAGVSTFGRDFDSKLVL